MSEIKCLTSSWRFTKARIVQEKTDTDSIKAEEKIKKFNEGKLSIDSR